MSELNVQKANSGRQIRCEPLTASNKAILYLKMMQKKAEANYCFYVMQYAPQDMDGPGYAQRKAAKKFLKFAPFKKPYLNDEEKQAQGSLGVEGGALIEAHMEWASV